MSDEFDWLLKKYQVGAAKVLEGEVLLTMNSPFSIPVMDACFDFSTKSIDGIKQYLMDAHSIVPKNIIIFTAFRTNLERTSHSMKTESSLYVVKNKEGEVNALFFTGCVIDDLVQAKYVDLNLMLIQITKGSKVDDGKMYISIDDLKLFLDSDSLKVDAHWLDGKGFLKKLKSTVDESVSSVTNPPGTGPTR